MQQPVTDVPLVTVRLPWEDNSYGDIQVNKNAEFHWIAFLMCDKNAN